MGPFNCVGMNFALQEVLLMVGKIVHRLEFRLVVGTAMDERQSTRSDQIVPLFQVQDALSSVRDGPMLQSKKRNSS